MRAAKLFSAGKRLLVMRNFNSEHRLSRTHTFAVLCTLAALFFSVEALAQQNKKEKKMEKQSGLETATFGSGCFWCSEAIFLNVDGVKKVVSGYSGGTVKNPTYEEVCTGRTGHAEVVQLAYDPQLISYDQLLEIFWKTHDPTTLNQQGADVGTQYRSVIFYHSPEQKERAVHYKARLEEAHAFDKPIVTQILPATDFYQAEDYHRDYYNLNGNAPYCTFVIKPKLEKFKKAFQEVLKD